MSKREMVDNAKRLGRKAFWNNEMRLSNPMKGKRSCQAWEEAWDKEDKFKRESDEAMELIYSGMNQRAREKNYYTQVEMRNRG